MLSGAKHLLMSARRLFATLRATVENVPLYLVKGKWKSPGEKGLARARQFTWERTAQETMRVYQAVLDGSS